MNKIRFLKDKIMLRIDLKKDTVFLRNDFKDLGGYDQVGRELRKLVREGKIIKIGYGLYAKAEVSPFNGELIPQKNLPALAKEALQRLGIETTATTYEKNYNMGKSTQVPTGRVIAVKGRVVRKIGYGGTYVSYERVAG
jgi:hypothetical protein